MGDAAESQLRFAIEVFRGLLEHDPDIAVYRAAYCSFFRDYLNKRLMPAIHRKLDRFSELQEMELQEIATHLAESIRVPDAAADYRRLEDAVSFDMFGGKARLMQDFRRRIDALCNLTRQAAEATKKATGDRQTT